MPVSSNFSNGYGKAIAFLDYIGGKEDTFILDRQAHKYANVIGSEDHRYQEERK